MANRLGLRRLISGDCFASLAMTSVKVPLTEDPKDLVVHCRVVLVSAFSAYSHPKRLGTFWTLPQVSPYREAVYQRRDCHRAYDEITLASSPGSESSCPVATGLRAGHAGRAGTAPTAAAPMPRLPTSVDKAMLSFGPFVAYGSVSF